MKVFKFFFQKGLQIKKNFLSLQSQIERDGERSRSGLDVMIEWFRELKNTSKIYSKTFGQLK